MEGKGAVTCVGSLCGGAQSRSSDRRGELETVEPAGVRGAVDVLAGEYRGPYADP